MRHIVLFETEEVGVSAEKTEYLPKTEELLAKRLQELRTKEGWSFGELSQRMAGAGCPIERSSIQKIERGKPRRKITVNELVAFSKVFNVDVSDLLESPPYQSEQMFLRDLEDGPRLAADALDAKTRLATLVDRVADACLDPEDGPKRERRIREAAAAAESHEDPNKRKFLEDVLYIVDLHKEVHDDEG